MNLVCMTMRCLIILGIFLPTVTAATTGDTITDNVTPPAMAKFRLCLEISLPSYRL